MFRALACTALGLLAGLATPTLHALDQHTLVDPTQPPIVHQSAVRRLEIQQPQEYVLSAIKISGDARKALVNGKLVAEGELVGESRVVEIAADAVVMEYLSEQTRVALLPRKIRRPATAP